MIFSFLLTVSLLPSFPGGRAPAERPRPFRTDKSAGRGNPPILPVGNAFSASTYGPDVGKTVRAGQSRRVRGTLRSPAWTYRRPRSHFQSEGLRGLRRCVHGFLPPHTGGNRTSGLTEPKAPGLLLRGRETSAPSRRGGRARNEERGQKTGLSGDAKAFRRGRIYIIPHSASLTATRPQTMFRLPFRVRRASRNSRGTPGSRSTTR